MDMLARPAQVADGPVIAAIYNQGIEDRVATFETELRTPAEVAALLAERLPTHPAVVVEGNGRVVGFAWTAPYSSRPVLCRHWGVLGLRRSHRARHGRRPACTRGARLGV